MPLSDEALARLKAMGTKGRGAQSIARQLAEKPMENPLDSVSVTGDLQTDAAAGFAAILAAFDHAAAQEPPEWLHTSRSSRYVVIVFLLREDKEYFLLRARMFEAADKYLAYEDWTAGLEQVAKQGPANVDYRRHQMPMWTTNTNGEPITEQQLKFRQASWNATRNNQIRGDSEFWFALCFRSDADRDAFLRDHPSVPGTTYLDGYAVAESIGITIPV